MGPAVKTFFGPLGMMAVLKLLAVASPLDPGFAASIRGATFSLISSAESAEIPLDFLGLEGGVGRAPTGGQGDLAVAVMTGGTEGTILRVARSWEGGIALLATPHSNSLAASLEAAAALRSEGRFARVVRADSWASFRWEDVLKAVRMSKAVQMLSKARFGLLGPPSDWLVASHPTLGPLERFGASLEEVDLGRLVEAYERCDSDPRDVEAVISGAKEILVPGDEVRKALRMKRALEEALRSGGYLGITVRCFDLIEMGVTACLGAAALNDADAIVGCEGDVPSMISMAVLAAVSGRPAWMANTTDVGRDSLLLSHCTFPLKLAEAYSLKTHFESGLSVGVDAELPPGERVTVARVDPRGARAIVGVGSVRESSLGREAMCRTQVLLSMPGADRLIRAPIGNHLAMTRGDFGDEVQEVLEFLGFTVSRL